PPPRRRGRAAADGRAWRRAVDRRDAAYLQPGAPGRAAGDGSGGAPGVLRPLRRRRPPEPGRPPRPRRALAAVEERGEPVPLARRRHRPDALSTRGRRAESPPRRLVGGFRRASRPSPARGGRTGPGRGPRARTRSRRGPP